MKRFALEIVVRDHERAGVDLANGFKSNRDDDKQSGAPDGEVRPRDAKRRKDVFEHERQDSNKAERE